MKINPIYKTTVLLWALFGMAFGVRAQAPPKPFSADQVMKVGAKTLTGRVYGTNTAMRTESESNGTRLINIVRSDRNVVWSLLPDKKIYFEVPLPSVQSATALARKGAGGPAVQHQNLGTERVGSYLCAKTMVMTTSGGKSYAFTEWAAKELGGFVVKREAKDGSWSIEYQNVQLAPQNSSLFELPQGYQKMDLGGMQH